MEYRYGHFNADGNEFIVTNPQTPRAFDNILWNQAVFSNVQQTGVGYFDYQIDDLKGIQFSPVWAEFAISTFTAEIT